MILEPCELGSRTAVRDWTHGKHKGRTQGFKQVGRESRRNAYDSNHTVPAQRVCGLFRSVPDQPPDQCVHSPLISACQSLITA